MKENLARSGISLKSAPAASLAALVASATAALCSVVKAKTRKGLCAAAGLLAALVFFSLQPHTWATDMGPLTNIDGISFEAGNLQEVGGHAVSGRGPAELEGEEPGDMRGEMATDLLTGERRELEDAVIAPASSAVFVLDGGS